MPTYHSEGLGILGIFGNLWEWHSALASVGRITAMITPTKMRKMEILTITITITNTITYRPQEDHNLHPRLRHFSAKSAVHVHAVARHKKEGLKIEDWKIEGSSFSISFSNCLDKFYLYFCFLSIFRNKTLCQDETSKFLFYIELNMST